jgi:UDP-N-acetylmuramoylalanine--D-glutamate ligase
MNEADYTGRTVLVVGAARSGVASARFLLSRGARVVLTDKQDQRALSATLAPLLKQSEARDRLRLELGGHRPETFRNCDLVVVSPGVPLSLPAFQQSRNSGIPVIAEVELASRHLKGRILGITGSNGKTTTTTLVAELLRGCGFKAYTAGNIGNPLIDFVDRGASDDVYSTELSSFQLEGIQQLRPKVSAILNLSPDHLDRYSGFEDYIAAKRRIFMNQGPGDFTVLNADDPRTAAMRDEVRSTAVLFSRRQELSSGMFVKNGKVTYRDGDREHSLFPAADMSLRGGHNLENVLAASAVALLAGVQPASMGEVIRNFRGVEHRLEWVATIDGVDYFNDSKATNVDATIKSLEAFAGNIHLIAGGRDKASDFGVLRSLVKERVKRVVLLGEAAGKLRDALSGTAPVSEVTSMAGAVRECRNSASPGDVVLLAPACASFDMFENYEHRGRVYKEAVFSLQHS